MSASAFTHLPHPNLIADDVRAAAIADPVFGRVFTDHMVSIRYKEGLGWHDAKVMPRGPLSIDPASREVLLDDEPVPLTRTEFDILAALSSRPGVVWSRRQLIDAVWGENYSGGYGLTIRIISNDRSGLLRDITTVLANEKINVMGVRSRSNVREQTAEIDMELEIYNINAFNRALAKLSQLNDVISAKRL